MKRLGLHRFRPVLAAAIVAGTLAVVFAAGCAKKGSFAPNVPPETTLFVQGPVDPVNHIVHLYWFGTDPDGEVDGFQLRFTNNAAAPADTQWVWTTRTDSIFTVFTPTGAAMPTFEVRAVDNEGALDPTPATEDFSFTNQPPVVTLTNPPRTTDTTYASMTLNWVAQDIDGDVTKTRFLVRLVRFDGAQARDTITTSTSYVIPTDYFRIGEQLSSGLHTVTVIPIDDGGRAGTPATATWYVRAPAATGTARLLLIDDFPSSLGAALNFSTDTMYSNTAARNILSPGVYSILRLEFTQPFRSAADVRQTFQLFDAVIWYRGTQTSFSTLLATYQDGIAAYLDGNATHPPGRFLIEGLNLIQGRAATGPLREDWVTRYFGSDRLMLYETLLPGDSSAVWGLGNSGVLNSTAVCDSLRAGGISSGLRGFAVRDTHDVLLWARSGQLTQQASQFQRPDIPVAVSVPHDPADPSGGRAAIMTVPMRGMNGYSSVPRFLAKVFYQFGLTAPGPPSCP